MKLQHLTTTKSELTRATFTKINHKLITSAKMSKASYFNDKTGHSSNSSDEEEDELDDDDNSFIDDGIEVSEHGSNESIEEDIRPIKKARSQPTQADKRPTKTTTEPDKEPGDSSFPLNNFSLTLSKCKGDVPLALLDVFHKWIIEYCMKG